MLLEKPDQIFYTGTVLSENIQNKKIIISLSSLLLIRLLKHIELVNKISNNVFATQGVTNIVKSLFEDIKTIRNKTSGSMGIDQYGKPFLIPFEKEHKEGRLNFYKDLLEFINNAKQQQMDSSFEPSLKKELLLHIKQIVVREELECIYLAKQLDAIFLCDDNFVQN